MGIDKALWYRRTFTVDKKLNRERLLLNFGAVDWHADVWVNGKMVGGHKGGYDPFTFDITNALKKEGPQTIVVRVWDPTDKGDQPRGKQVTNPRGIWYTSVTGIWQTVWLESVPETYVQSIKFVPDVDNSQLRLTVELNCKDKDTSFEAKVTYKGQPVTLEMAKSKKEKTTIVLKNP